MSGIFLPTGQATPSGLYLGATPVQSVYKGSSKVWPASPIFDSVGASYHGGNTHPISPSWQHIIGSSVDILIVGVGVIDASSTVSAVSAAVGASAMTQAVWANYSTPSTSHYYIGLFYLLNPPTGTQTVSMSLNSTASMFAAANSVAYTSVSSVGTPVSGAGSANGTIASHTVSSAVGQMVVQLFTNTSSAPGTFTSYNQTQRYLQAGVSSSNPPIIIGDAAGASSVLFSATQSSSVFGSAALSISS